MLQFLFTDKIWCVSSYCFLLLYPFLCSWSEYFTLTYLTTFVSISTNTLSLHKKMKKKFLYKIISCFLYISIPENSYSWQLAMDSVILVFSCCYLHHKKLNIHIKRCLFSNMFFKTNFKRTKKFVWCKRCSCKWRRQPLGMKGSQKYTYTRYTVADSWKLSQQSLIIKM